MKVKSNQTINVVTYNNGTITSLFSFSTDDNGVAGAEAKFIKKIKDYEFMAYDTEVSEEQLNWYLDDGHYESSDEVFEVYLIWSDHTEVDVDVK